MNNLHYYQQQLELIEAHNDALEAEINALRTEFWDEAKRLGEAYRSFAVRRTVGGFRIDWQKVIYKRGNVGAAPEVDKYQRINLNKSSKDRPSFRQCRKTFGRANAIQASLLERYDPILVYYRRLGMINENLTTQINKAIDLAKVND